MRTALHRLPAMLRYWQHALQDRLSTRTGASREVVDFRCNICGRPARVPKCRLGRELPSCRCGSTVRHRALIHVLCTELFGRSYSIPEMPARPDLRGLDMSGASVYADRLARKLGYVNTFLHRPPYLDIVEPSEEWLARQDFVISSDVFEHVAPPVSRAFENALHLLKPGGVLVLTVPYSPDGRTVEHFPELHDYRIETRKGKAVLVNLTVDGRTQEFASPVFHGGAGDTLELRVFSEQDLVQALGDAGFCDIRIHRDPHLQFGITWPEPWSLPLSARRPTALADPDA